MIDFSNIKEYAVERPNGGTCLGSPEEFDALSTEFKDQILFLNEEASKFLYDYLKVSKLHTGPIWSPFEKKNFKFIEQIGLNEEEATIKNGFIKEVSNSQNGYMFCQIMTKEVV